MIGPRVRAVLTALLSGVLLALSFAPFNLYLLAWISLVPLFCAVVRAHSAWSAAGMGFVSGLTFHLLAIPWIANVVSGYSQLPDILVWLLVVLLAGWMALFPAAVAFLLHGAVRRGGIIQLWLAPVLWTGAEYLQTYLLTGFPWNLLGYSQVFLLPIIQFADITGVYGVSFLLVLTGAGIAAWGFTLLQKQPGEWRLLAVAGLLVLAALGYGILKLEEPTVGEEFGVTLVQDELDNAGRLAADQRALFAYYLDSTIAAARAGADVVLWGEGALLFLDMVGDGPDGAPEGFNEQYVLSLPRDEDFWLLTGSNDYFEAGSRLYNVAITAGPENGGRPSGRYAKNHLTPFGEYVPFTWIFGWLDKIVPEIASFAEGDQLNTMPLRDGRVGTPICLEIIFPDLVRRFTYNGATILATVSNDAWFGRSAANDQHFNMAIMRAVENRRFLLRCAVSGVSGIIAPDGNVQSRTQTYQRALVRGTVAMRSDLTLYAQFGDAFAWLCLSVAIIAVLRLRYTPQSRTAGAPAAATATEGKRTT